jgi:hypothetical protein
MSVSNATFYLSGVTNLLTKDRNALRLLGLSESLLHFPNLLREYARSQAPTFACAVSETSFLAIPYVKQVSLASD